MLNSALHELRLIAENRTIDGYKIISTTLRPISENNPLQRPMEPEGKAMMKKIKREHNQTAKRYKRKNKKTVIINLRHLFKEEDQHCYKPCKIQTAFNVFNMLNT